MAHPLRILILEERPVDAELIAHTIRESGLEVDAIFAGDETSFLKALVSSPDIILADYNLPRFNAQAALGEVRKRDLDIPFILVSSSAGEEQAVEAIRLGAADYLLKDRLTRLPQAIARALEEKQSRDKRRALRIELAQKEAQYREIVEGTDDLITRVDRKGKFLFVNACSEKYFGLSPQECVGRSAFDFVHPEDREWTRKAFRGWIKDKTESVCFENRQVNRQGQVFHMYWTINARFDGQGEIQSLNSIARDISDLKKVQEQLQESLRIQAAIIEASPAAIFAVAPDNTIMAWNESAERVFGWTTEEVMGKPYPAAPPGKQAEFQNHMRRVLEGQKIFQKEILRQAKDGTPLHLSLSAGPIYGDHGQIKGVMAVIFDITERKQAEEERERLLSIIDNTPDIVSFTNPDGHIQYINQAGRKIFGLAPDIDLNKLPIARLHPQWATDIVLQEGIPSALRDGTWLGETAILDKNGREISSSQVIIAHRHKSGAVTHLSTILRDISEQKKLAAERERLVTVLEATPDTVIIGEMDGGVLFINDSGRRMLGLNKKADLPSMSVEDFHPAWAVEIIRKEGIPTALRKGTWTGESALLTVKGKEIPVSQVLIAHRREDGTVSHLSTVMRDITDRVAAEAVLKKSKQGLELALDAASMGTWEWIAESDQGRWDEHTNQLLGLPQGTLGEGFEKFSAMIHPDDRSRVAQEIAELIQEGSSYRSEYRIIRPDGEVRWLASRGRLDRDAMGKALRMSGILMDVTESKEAEEVLHRTAETLKALIDAAPLAISVLSQDGQISFWNPAAEKIFGWPAKEAIKALSQPVPREERDEMKDILAKIFAGENLSGIELLRTRKDGSKVDVRIFAAPIRDQKGRITAALGIAEDITDSKLAEAALRQTTEALQSVINASPLAITAVDREGRVTLWNHAAEQVYGWLGDEVQGKPIPTIPAEMRESWSTLIARIFAGETMAGVEGKRKTRDGRLLDVRLFTAPLRDLDGRITSIMGIAEDVTEIRRAQRELERTQERLKAFLASNVVGISFGDIHGNVADANNRYLEIIGYDRTDLEAGKINWLDITPPEFHPLNRAKIEEAQEQGSCIPFEKQYLRRDGSRIWILIGFILTGKNMEEVVSFVLDITDRKLAQQQLQEQKERLDLALHAAHMGVWDRDLQRDFNFWDETVYRIFDRDPGLPVPSIEEFQKMIHPEDREPVKKLTDRAVATLGTLEAEYRIVLPDGRVRHIASRARVRSDEQGRPARLGGVLFDITEQMENLKKLRESEEAYRLLFDASPVPMWVYDLENYKFLAVNEETTVRYGYSREEFLNMDLRQIRPPKEIDRLEEFLHDDERNWLAGQTWIHQTGRGEKLEVLSFRYPLMYSGRPAALVVSLDVTERNQREREMAAITAMTNSLRSARSSSELQGLILDGVLDLLHADGSALLFEDPESDRMAVGLGRGLWSEVSQKPITEEDGCARHVFRKNTACVNAGALKSDTCLCPCFGTEDLAVACVPMISHDRTLGVLSIGRKNPIVESDLRILMAMGDIAGTAIHRSELHEQTERHLNRLLTLRNIDLAITSSLDLRLTLDILLEQLETQMKIDASTVLLLNPDLGMLEYAAGRGFHTRRIRETRLRLGESRAGEAALKRQPVIIADFSNDMSGFVCNTLVREEGFQAYCAVPLIAKGEVQGVLETFHRTPQTPTSDWLEFLESIGLQAAIAVENSALFTDLQRSNLDLRLAYDKTIEGWSRALDLRDKETEGHSLRVTEHTVRLARECGLSPEELVPVRWGALLHDIGKMGVPDQILLKPGPLDEEEWRIMKQHPTFAFQLLSPIPHLKGALEIPYSHHEKWDGSGYPRGLKREEIPFPARIFAVIDVWDALRSDRPYRPAWSPEKAMDNIIQGAGSHFDPQVVEAFLRLDW